MMEKLKKFSRSFRRSEKPQNLPANQDVDKKNNPKETVKKEEKKKESKINKKLKRAVTSIASSKPGRLPETVEKIDQYRDADEIELQIKKVVGNDESLISLNVNGAEFASVPRFVVECVKEIEKRDVATCGIYRVGTRKAAVLAIIQTFHNKENFDLCRLFDYNVHAFCGALKHYLRMVPITFFGEAHFTPLRQVYRASVVDRAEVTNLALLRRDLHEAFFLRMSPVQFETLQFFMRHLCKVAQRSEENSMSASNLATCVWLSLVQQRNGLASLIQFDLDHIRNLTEIMIAHYEYIFNDAID